MPSKPDNSTLTQILPELIRAIRSSSLSDEGLLRALSPRFDRQIAALIEREQRSHPSTQRLRLIETLLDGVYGGVSHDELLRDLFSGLAERGVRAADHIVLVLEGYGSGDAPLDQLDAPYLIGGNPGRHEQFDKALRGMTDSAFFKALLVDRLMLDFDSTTQMAEFDRRMTRYDGEFRTLISGDAWVCTYPLVSRERTAPDRSLVAIYPAQDAWSNIVVPPAARQEWEMLRMVPAIFVLLQESQRDLDAVIAQDTMDLIRDLAPRAINHDLATNLNMMQQSVNETVPALRTLVTQLGDHDPTVVALAREIDAIAQNLRAARRTTEAFNNLERRGMADLVRLSVLIDEVAALLDTRMAAMRITLTRDIGADIEFQSDARFVTNIIMNVVINAVEAIEDEQRSVDFEDRPKRNILIAARLDEDHIAITIANDGPAIPPHLTARVFDRGQTSKELGRGHGQGLFLCRQIATYLGGSIGFGPPPAAMPTARVHFEIEFPVLVANKLPTDEERNP